MDPRWKHPFTCIVAGPTGCGKTMFVARLLRNASTMIITRTRFVVLRGMAISVRESRHTKLAPEQYILLCLHLEEGLQRLTSFDASKRNILVLDDIMAETDERVTNLFTKKKPPLQYIRHISRAKPVSKKQGESHNQFELTLHSGVQESARCVANDYIGQTDVSRSSQVCSGVVRRCDVHSLRVHFGRSEAGHPRGSTLAHVHTTGRCCSVCIHAKRINSRANCVTPHSTMTLRVTCLYWYNAETTQGAKSQSCPRGRTMRGRLRSFRPGSTANA